MRTRERVLTRRREMYINISYQCLTLEIEACDRPLYLLSPSPTKTSLALCLSHTLQLSPPLAPMARSSSRFSFSLKKHRMFDHRTNAKAVPAECNSYLQDEKVITNSLLPQVYEGNLTF